MKPEAIWEVIKGNAPRHWLLGYPFTLSDLTLNLNRQGHHTTRKEVALALHVLTRCGCHLTISDTVHATSSFEYRQYEGDLNGDLLKEDSQLWLTPPGLAN